jgi:hypothetical protein
MSASNRSRKMAARTERPREEPRRIVGIRNRRSNVTLATLKAVEIRRQQRSVIPLAQYHSASEDRSPSICCDSNVCSSSKNDQLLANRVADELGC